MLEIEQFYDWLIEDVMSAEFAELPRYYKNIRRGATYQPFYRYIWQRRVEPMVELLRSLPQRDRAWRVLDAGCGIGTESLLWAGLREDVEVLGVDMTAERIAAAKTRLPIFERRYKRTPNLQFAEANIFDLMRSQTFDLIWTMEALSHIDPAERFLRAAHGAIAKRGYLVVSDSHLANPAMLYRIARLRWKGIQAHTTRQLSTGETIPYAEERLFSVWKLTRMLERAGFDVVSTRLAIYFPPRLAVYPRLLAGAMQLDRLLSQLPVIRQLGGIYTVVAQKR